MSPYAYIGFNLVPVLLLLACWRWKRFGRLSFVLLFLWAGQYNLRMALTNPRVYLAFAALTPVELYARFIQGFFAQHISLFVGAIAAGQILVGTLIALRGRAVRLGLFGAILFLIAIAPLGAGSGFPAPLIMAAAAASLFRADYTHTLPAEGWALLHGWTTELG